MERLYTQKIAPYTTWWCSWKKICQKGHSANENMDTGQATGVNIADNSECMPVLLLQITKSSIA